jgi:hypothetical protein
MIGASETRKAGRALPGSGLFFQALQLGQLFGADLLASCLADPT